MPGAPRLHFLEWNPRGRVCVVLLHGSSANAWWWEWVADALAGQEEIRLVAVDLRGHGDSEWVRPPAYKPGEYADDVARFIDGLGLTRPVVAGHSMGGIVALTFALRYPQTARAIIAIDVAITSTARRDRYLRHLKSLPTIVYPDLETARSRFRLMPNEGEIPASTLARIAENSLERTEDGRYTMKFARESFFGGDGLDVAEAIKAVTVPTLLVRAEKSRIMTAEAAVRAADSNPMVQLTEIPGAHHHLPLERPGEMAAVIEAFVREIQ
ncbi:MAG: alpha/beta fold hydrolase [Candidatus Binataceae bacterium]